MRAPNRLIALFALLTACSSPVGESDVGLGDVFAEDVVSDSDADVSTAVTDAADVDTVSPEVGPEIESRLVSEGACTNAVDSSFLEAPETEQLEDCMATCDSDDCAIGCFVEREGVTWDCAACFVERTRCDSELCGAEACDGPDCRACSEEACEPEFLHCAGVLSPGAPDEPARSCRASDRDLDLTSLEFSTTGNSCASQCDTAECLAECLVDETELGLGCALCFGDWWTCSEAECLARCDVQFSEECLECGIYAACTNDLVTCLGVGSMEFDAPPELSATVRISVLSDRPSLALVDLETGSPAFRTLRYRDLTSFEPFEFRDGFQFGLTEGNIGEGAEVLAEVEGTLSPGQQHTLTIYDSGGDLRSILFEEPRISAASLRVFNGLAESVVVTVDETAANWMLASGELGEAVTHTGPGTVRVNGIPFDMMGFGSTASTVLWISESEDQLAVRLTTASHGFADLVTWEE